MQSVFLPLFRRAVARRRVPVADPADGRRIGVRRPRIHVAQQEDVAMRTFDPTPLWRSTIGFDRLFNLIDETARWAGDDNYPPYNIERTGEDQYQISLALAGFSPDDVTITAEQNVLTVEGRKADKAERQYLYQGISARPFKRVFNLADYVEVKGATFESGLLKVALVREVPEAMKPRRIAINNFNDDSRTIEHRKAA
jgi:molecular chaperone IbpA